MDDIARRVGVSVSTVSRALKDNPRISVEIRARVKAAASELGYRPNPLVRALMESRRGSAGRPPTTIAFVTDYESPASWDRKPTCCQTFKGVQERARQCGYQIDVISTAGQTETGTPLCRVVRARGICGVVFGFSLTDRHPFSFDASNLCVVGLINYFPALQLDRAWSNDYLNVRLAFDQLRRRGYRKTGLVVPDYNNILGDGLWSASALEHARTLRRAERCPPLVTTSAGQNPVAFFRWFDRHRPDSILAYKIPVAKYLRERGIDVPGEVGVATLYRTEEEKSAMAGVDPEFEAIGAAAIDLLVTKLHTNDFGFAPQGRQIHVQGNWCDGSTVRSPNFC